jgi:4'-phosphopantetheinyl transferase
MPCSSGPDGASIEGVDGGEVADGCGVWVVDVRSSEDEYERAWGVLSNAERERAKALASEARRRQFVAARAAVRVRLGRALGVAGERVRIYVDENGKPKVAAEREIGATGHAADRGEDAGARGARGRERRLRFNISHSGALALIAIRGEGEVGVDIERVALEREGRPWGRLLERICGAGEWGDARARMREVGVKHALYERWVRKEAVVKALGCGLRVSPADVVLGRDAGGELRLEELRGWVDAAGKCRLAAVAVPEGFVAAVALVDGAPRPLRSRWGRSGGTSLAG